MRRLGIFRCYYCDKQLSRQKKTRDHLYPRSKGGSNSAYNVVDACRQCNGDKGSLLLEEYRRVVAFRLEVPPNSFKFPGELKRIGRESAHQQKLQQQKNKRSHRMAKTQAGVCCYCYKQNPVLPDTTYCKTCAEQASKAGRQRRAKRKQLGLCTGCGCGKPSAREHNKQPKKICFDHYGRVCLCCKQSFDERFLTLNHVQNDGAQHHEEIWHSTLYKWAIKNNFPINLQTNCWNCNMGKSVNGGVCPHQE